jgi:hypothetical protein
MLAGVDDWVQPRLQFVTPLTQYMKQHKSISKVSGLVSNMPLYTFASDAIAALINVTHHEKSAFCNNLTAELFLVQELIQSGQNAEDAKSEDRLRALLRNLERLCKVRMIWASLTRTTKQPNSR